MIDHGHTGADAPGGNPCAEIMIYPCSQVSIRYFKDIYALTGESRRVYRERGAAGAVRASLKGIYRIGIHRIAMQSFSVGILLRSRVHKVRSIIDCYRRLYDSTENPCKHEMFIGDKRTLHRIITMIHRQCEDIRSSFKV